MKSSDERIDEELRNALRQRFDNFERLPDPTLREKIFQGLGGGTSMVQTSLIASLALLIALTGAVYFVSAPAVRENQVLTKIQQLVPQTLPEEQPTTPAPPATSRLPVQELQKAETELRADRPESPSPAIRAAAKSYRVKRADIVKMVEKIRSDPSFGSLWSRDGDISPADRTFLESELKKMELQPADSATVALNNIKELEGPSLADQDIGVLDHRPMALPQYNWQPDSLITPGEPRKRFEYAFKEGWGIIAGFTPLRTFQILTVRPGNGVVYQNFVLPGKISAQTVGYKFSAGVERKGFQLLLNYGQFKQSYRYEIATSEFTVGPDLSGNYEVIRKGIPQEENSTVRLVGLAVKKHSVRRSHFLRNYFGDVGAEFSRDLSSKKNLVWINAGFGKELFAGGNVVMSVGPYLEYSLSKLRNPDNPFKIQPYQIGLSVDFKISANSRRNSSP